MNTGSPRSRWAGTALRWLPALLPLLPIGLGLWLTAGNADAGRPAGAPGLLHPLTQRTPAAAPAATPGLTLPPGHGALVAVLTRPAALRTAPGGRVLAHVGRRSDFGSPEVLWVRSVRGTWLGTVSPEAGNGRLGWIPRTATRLERVDWQLRVSLAARQLVVRRAGQVLHRYTVAVGRPDAPTPTGHFAVTDRLRTGDPAGPYGCCILALSARAPHTIQGWSGGDRIAIHSTPETSTIGQAISHGCVRLTLAEGQWLLDHIPLGTPVVIART